MLLGKWSSAVALLLPGETPGPRAGTAERRGFPQASRQPGNESESSAGPHSGGERARGEEAPGAHRASSSGLKVRTGGRQSEKKPRLAKEPLEVRAHPGHGGAGD